MKDSFIGRQLGNLMNRQVQGMFKDDPDSPTAILMQATVREAPLRLMLMMGDGAVSREMLHGLLIMMNGRLLKGLAALVKAIRANRKQQK